MQGNAGKPGDFGEPIFQQAKHRAVALALVGWHERMNVSNFRPAQRHHFRGGIELHGAGAQGDHRLVEREILGFQPLEVAQHLGFGVIAVEHRLGEKRGFAGERGGPGGRGGVAGRSRRVRAKRGGNRGHVGGGGSLIERNPEVIGIDAAQIDPGGHGGHENGIRLPRHVGDEGVEEGTRLDFHIVCGKGFSQGGGVGVDPAGEVLESFRDVVNRIHRRHHGEQDLGGANVGSGLVAADVLLAGLQREPEARLAAGIHGHPDQATGHFAFQLVLAGHEPGMRTAEPERHAKPLGRTDADVRAKLTRSFQHRERQQIRRRDGNRPGRLGLGEKRGEVIDPAAGVRVLHQHGEQAGAGRGIECFPIARQHGDAERFGAGDDDVERLRMAAVGDEDRGAFRLAGERQAHRLGGGGAFVEQRGVGDVQGGEVGDHRLEIEQGFEAALGDFRLIGSIGGVPPGIFQNVALNHAGRVGAIVALADKRLEEAVFAHDALEPTERVLFGAGFRQLQRVRQPDPGRHGGIDERLQAGISGGTQHFITLGTHGTQVATAKIKTGGHMTRKAGRWWKNAAKTKG